MAKTAINNKTNGFEQNLWDTANKLRGSVESSEYKHVVLSLIFLKFASDKFEERRAELVAEGKDMATNLSRRPLPHGNSAQRNLGNP